MRECIQCLVLQNEDQFRMNTSRGIGLRKTTCSLHTVCKTCERVNALALTAESRGDDSRLEELRKYYGMITGKLPAVGRRLVGLPEDTTSATQRRGNTLAKALDMLAVREAQQQCEAATQHIQGDGRTLTDTMRLVDTLDGNVAAAQWSELPGPLSLIDLMGCLREKRFNSLESAESAVDETRDQLRDAGLYEEADKLLDTWDDRE